MKSRDQARLAWVLGGLLEKGTAEGDGRHVLILGAGRSSKSCQVRVQVQAQDESGAGLKPGRQP